MLTQGALLVAVVLAIRVNPSLSIRPNLLLLLLSLLATQALVTSLHNEFWVGSTYRGLRFLLFVVVVWLLSPLWGRGDKVLLRAHITVLQVIVGSVVIGLALSPGAALGSGRLEGVLWMIPATQVAHYAAVLLGLLVIHSLLLVDRSRWTPAWMLVCLAALVGTHTRTALIGLVAGLVVAIASLFMGYARVRRASAVAVSLLLVSVLAFGPLIGAWLLRGQSTSEVALLTGRALVWEQLLGTSRGYVETILGSGMSNASFNGLPIDSSWLATFYDLGLLGITIQVLALLVLLVTAAVRPRGHARAAALFLVVYCIVASFTETALNSPSGYLLDLVVAASLLALPTRGTRRSVGGEITALGTHPEERVLRTNNRGKWRLRARVRVAS
jgi:hypothetical protein